MSTTSIIIVALVSAFIAYMVYNFRKLKNMPVTADHKKIITLNDTNFKNQTKSGILLVDFWAPWCGPCKMMAPVLNEMAEMDSDKVTIAKVNVDQQQQLATKFNIRSIPTLVMFANGKEVKRFSGIKNRSFLLKEVQMISK
jgi:thioredoxin 1